MNLKVRLVERGRFFLIKDPFSPSITAGFTKPFISEKFISNFQDLLLYIGKSASFSYMIQKHLSEVSLIEGPGAYEADGLFTKKKNLFLMVKSADCLPIFLAQGNKWVGAVHMGWRPAREGILKNIPFDLSGFRAVAGVGLRSCCYRVGAEFIKYPQFSCYLKKTSQGLFFDPVEFAKTELVRLGLLEANFFDLGLCSFCSEGDFPSWRRNKTANRTLSFISRDY